MVVRQQDESKLDVGNVVMMMIRMIGYEKEVE